MTREMHPQRWGDPAQAAPLPPALRHLVEAVFGGADAPAVDVVGVPASRLGQGLLESLRGVVGTEHVLVDDATRRLRTRGKSTPDLIRARAGDLADAPDAVVRPGSHGDVAAVLQWAVDHDVAVVPFGGGTCVTGGLVADRAGRSGVVSLDLSRMDRLVSVDRVSMTATFEPGVRGPEAERLLAAEGLMLGHYPQSFEFASLGGFAATCSSGQSSAGYGRFADLVVALRVATPIGELTAGSSPASAAGPDLRQVVLGSEGSLGVITQITVRVRELPVARAYDAWRFESFAAGSDAVRHLAQHDRLPTVIRLSDEAETMLNLASQTDIGGTSAGGCVMIVGHEGDAETVATKRDATTATLTALGGTALGPERGEAWVHGRFHAPYLRDAMLDAGVLVETLETATFWSNRGRLHADVRAALEESLGDPTMVLCHISHVYPTGCSLYFTVVASGGPATLERWLTAKAAASEAIIAAGATITHHHAVGTDHKPWLAREIGPVGVAMLRALKDAVDPTGILNPGVLIP